MVLDPIPQSLPVHFFGSRPQPPTSHKPCHTFMSQAPCEWVMMPHMCEYVTHEWIMSHTDLLSENQTCGWQLLNLVTRWRTRFFGTLCVLQLLRCLGMLQCVALCVWSQDGAIHGKLCEFQLYQSPSVLQGVFGHTMAQKILWVVICVSAVSQCVAVCCSVCLVTR